MKDGSAQKACCLASSQKSFRQSISTNWLIKGSSVNLVKRLSCPNCGSLVLPASFSPEQITSHFSAAPYRDKSMETDIASDKGPRYQKIFKELGRFFPNGGTFADVGCAHGYGLTLGNENNWQGIGVDICPEISLFASKKGFPVYTGNSVSFIPGDKKFKAILYMDVIYYFFHPAEELKQAWERLADDGILCFRVSFWGPLVHLLNGLGERLGIEKLRSAASYLVGDHVIEFSEKGFYELLDNSGFRVIGSSIDWGNSWRAGDSLPAWAIRNIASMIGNASAIKISPAYFVFAIKK